MVASPTGDVAEVNHYYPYGMLMTPEAGVQPHKYGGKELDRENGLDWYDSQARWYDPALGRTTTMDSKAEDYPSVSPYAWCAGNPVRFTDPTGMDEHGLPFYDYHDEVDAYKRGRYWGCPSSEIPSVYERYSKKKLGIGSLDSTLLNSTYLQTLSNRSRSAFRYNGKTYKYK